MTGAAAVAVAAAARAKAVVAVAVVAIVMKAMANYHGTVVDYLALFTNSKENMTVRAHPPRTILSLSRSFRFENHSKVAKIVGLLSSS